MAVDVKRKPYGLTTGIHEYRKPLEKLVKSYMSTMHLILMAGILAIISTTSAQNPIDAAANSLQQQMNAAGQQLQEKAVSHIVEGNFTKEHIAQDLNSTQKSLNLTPEKLKQKAEEELKKRVSQEIQKQPGFGAVFAILAALAAVCLIRRRG
jgi:PGF-CTERM protein